MSAPSLSRRYHAPAPPLQDSPHTHYTNKRKVGSNISIAMAKRFTLVLLLLVALVAVATPGAFAQRRLKTHDDARALAAAATESSGNGENAAASENSSMLASTAEGSTSEKQHPKGPSLSSFTGPMMAGAVAIVLIGFVIAFKNRNSGTS